MYSLHSLVWRNLTGHKLRSALTALAITLGVAMVLAASIIGQAASRSASKLSKEGSLVDLEVYAQDRDSLFLASVVDKLRVHPELEHISPLLRGEAVCRATDVFSVTLLGVEPQSYAAIYQPELANGTFLDGPDTIVLPMAVAIENALNTGDEVVLANGERSARLTVVGRLEAEQDLSAMHEASMVYVPLETAQHLAGTSNQIDRVAMTLRPGANVEQIRSNLSSQLGDELVVVGAVGKGDTLATLMVQISLAMVGIIMLAAAAFVIANAFAMSITARTREIGSMRALGMTRRQITYTVLVEAGLLGLIGALVGVPAGVGLAWGVMRIRDTLDSGFAVPWWGIVTSAAMGLSVTLVGALQPALRASHVSPLVALRMTSQSQAEGWYVRHGGRAGAILLFVVLPTVVVLALILRPDFFMAFAFLGTGMLGTLAGAVLLMPVLVQPIARLVRPTLIRWFGAAGRLAADNLTRNRLRTALTAGALTIGLTTIVATTTLLTLSFKGGLSAFFGLFHEDVFVIPDIPGLLASGELSIESSMDVAYRTLDPALIETAKRMDAGTLVRYGFAPIPAELSSFPGAPGLFIDPEVFLPLGNFDFFEGDADSALEMMRRGRAMLLVPIVAERLGVGVGDVVPVQTARGTVGFAVAGIGGTSTNFSVFSYADGEAYFSLGHPSWLGMAVAKGRDVEAVLGQMREAIAPFGDVVVFDMRDSGVGGLVKIIDQLQALLNALLLLAVVVAGLGVVNTIVINVAERRREIALLRAVGATQRQVRQAVVAEAATLGVMAALVATVLGLTMVVLFALVFMPNGARSVGLRITWENVGRSLPPALRDLGISAGLSLVFGPLVAALAAYFPARQAAGMDVAEATRDERVALGRTRGGRRLGTVRGSAIETMEPARQVAVSPGRSVASIVRRGSLRARFVLGTAALMVLVLLGLVAVVIGHARVRMEEQALDALRTMVSWNAGMIELSLPDGAKTLDFSVLQGDLFGLDADALLRLEALLDDMTANGLIDFAVVDQDNVVLASLDARRIGTVASEPGVVDGAHAYSEREGRVWQMHALAPIRNAEGRLLGSVRLVADAQQVVVFLRDLRGALWGVGAAIVCCGLVVGWLLRKPLTAPHARLSLQAQLTLAMVIILILMIAALELAAIPIERRHVEDVLRESLVAAVEWVGQVASDSLAKDSALLPVSSLDDLDIETLMTGMQSLDPAKLQMLLQEADLGVAAYSALVDDKGVVVFSDQLALIGEHVGVSPETRVHEHIWRDDSVWVVTTPLRMGRDGEQVGALHVAMRRDRVETFLEESRNLFRLTGVIAVLAGVLLAQAIGGVVVVPARQVTPDSQIASRERQDLVLDVRTRDEFALLRAAFNQMAAGLRERAWLRDMFGRFVSREVAEAIRTGQVRLEGENRVVSVLFCDIRGFTARSEQHTPEEMVALLNEYLPVVVDAAQRHGGMVNKFGGDSTLVIYGAPRRLQESAYQAVLTALEMLSRLDRLNARLVERSEAPIRIGVGVNTGVALAGAVGPAERQEYAVIGDAVNLASRIEALNKSYPDYDLLISGHTFDALGRHRAEFEFADLGDVSLGAGGASVRVWAVIGSSRPTLHTEIGGRI